MVTITNLISVKKEAEKEIANATLKLEAAEKEILHFCIKYHNQLREAGFYQTKIYNGSKYVKIHEQYRIHEISLPYKNMGEGHYKKIEFKCSVSNKLVLLEKQNYDSFTPDVFICSIPLDLFDDNVKLKEFVDKFLVTNEENIEKSRLRAVEKEKKILQDKLDKLNAVGAK